MSAQPVGGYPHNWLRRHEMKVPAREAKQQLRHEFTDADFGAVMDVWQPKNFLVVCKPGRHEWSIAAG